MKFRVTIDGIAEASRQKVAVLVRNALAQREAALAQDRQARQRVVNDMGAASVDDAADRVQVRGRV